MLGTTLPTPLYVIYLAQWHFSPAMVTVIFAVYAAGVLAALLLAGRSSDQAEIAWRVVTNGSVWSHRLEATPGGTRVVDTREAPTGWDASPAGPPARSSAASAATMTSWSLGWHVDCNKSKRSSKVRPTS